MESLYRPKKPSLFSVRTWTLRDEVPVLCSEILANLAHRIGVMQRVRNLRRDVRYELRSATYNGSYVGFCLCIGDALQFLFSTFGTSCRPDHEAGLAAHVHLGALLGGAILPGGKPAAAAVRTRAVSNGRGGSAFRMSLRQSLHSVPPSPARGDAYGVAQRPANCDCTVREISLRPQAGTTTMRPRTALHAPRGRRQ